MDTVHKKLDAIIVGAGPAGLTAGLEFARCGIRPRIFDKGDRPGGIARTESHRGYLFDMGGHRFYTKSDFAETFWRQVLNEDFVLRSRQSRIYYRGKYFHYPPQIANTLAGLGALESLRVMLSWARWKLFPYRTVTSFEQWVTNCFGKRLFEIFFESYTEKVWGIPCSELSADWARQRIKGMSMRRVLGRLLLREGQAITSLIEEFHYPRRGPGMMWEAVASQIADHGGSVEFQSNVVAIHRNGFHIEAVTVERDGELVQQSGDYYVSSMPLSGLIGSLRPAPPSEVRQAAAALSHRDFLTVCLVIDHPELFTDNWLYIHEPSVRVGRIQNYKNWSADMVPEPSHTTLGLEYFCNKTEPFWHMEDRQLIELASQELEAIGLVPRDLVIDGCVHRVPDAYPVYDSTYDTHLNVLRDYCDRFRNMRTVGRNGLHRYNNQDHSMLTGMLAVRMLHLGEQHDLWRINAEQEYLEERRHIEESR